jgi:hypothetical protein
MSTVSFEWLRFTTTRKLKVSIEAIEPYLEHA